jgi:hypothetical protein
MFSGAWDRHAGGEGMLMGAECAEQFRARNPGFLTEIWEEKVNVCDGACRSES